MEIKVSKNEYLYCWYKVCLILCILLFVVTQNVSAGSTYRPGIDKVQTRTDILCSFSLDFTITANPTTIKHGDFSSIIVTVKHCGANLEGAYIILTPTGGTLPGTDGKTDLSGTFTTKFSSSTSGTFFVNISASHPDYPNTGTGSVQIDVQNDPPAAYFSSDTSSGQSPLTVTFDASGSKDIDGTIVSYLWNFGDGESGNNRIVTHTYQKTGEFIPSLTVTDNLGLRNTFTSIPKIIVHAITPTVSIPTPTVSISSPMVSIPTPTDIEQGNSTNISAGISIPKPPEEESQSPDIPLFSIFILFFLLTMGVYIVLFQRKRKGSYEKENAKIEKWIKEGYDVSELELKK